MNVTTSAGTCFPSSLTDLLTVTQKEYLRLLEKVGGDSVCMGGGAITPSLSKWSVLWHSHCQSSPILFSYYFNLFIFIFYLYICV